MAREMASNLKTGWDVRWQGEWLTILKASRTSDGVRVVFNDEGWYDLIPAHKMVTIRRTAQA